MAAHFTAEKHTLVLEQRIPPNYSATPREHEWHTIPVGSAPKDSLIDVTGQNFRDTMAAREELLARAPERSDTEYRVVFVTRTETREAIS